MTWEIIDALALISWLAAKLAPRYYVGLTGSVLLTGWSRNDLDLIIYPANSTDRDEEFVKKILREAGLSLRFDRDVVHAQWRRAGSIDEKHVEVWEYDGKK